MRLRKDRFNVSVRRREVDATERLSTRQSNIRIGEECNQAYGREGIGIDLVLW